MPPAGPKSDINRSGAEVTDFPAVCNDCLSATDNPFIQMIKEDHGMECKICTRPFTVFRWAADRTSRFKKTNICLTCARLKNCCQCCMLDLSFGLPIAVRDAALKLVAQGPSSGINKEYYAQNGEGALTDAQVPEEYEKTDDRARELLKRLAGSEPYYRRRRGGDGGGGEGSGRGGGGGVGPIRHRGGRGGRGGAGGGRGARFPGVGQIPPGPIDWTPPDDLTITSLFLTGVEDDLAEHHLRTFFAPYGAIKSIVCVHRSRCAFINFTARSAAESAASACQGKAVIAGCPLRVQWGRTRPLGNMDRGQSAAVVGSSAAQQQTAREEEEAGGGEDAGRGEDAEEEEEEEIVLAKPPGVDDVLYPSQVGS
ncbi:hypothetical protein L873DRAFT_1782959 [Choiromyces venosus 120613-1]|uniref:RRM domain-containing protein n=1 Tax=Choiromyces venosus 120613-1 TaxID=1336337 RepID=A0A3N4IVU1_9PEZI|nr:hypothetical protein L873DRAFT_1782959 [Choiromyces venosus 120613-1]